MKNSRHIVELPIATAIKYRLMFHAWRVAQTVIAPMLIYVLIFYRNVSELFKFDLPNGCVFTALDQVPWWNISPHWFFIGGVLLYCAIVAIFYDRKNESSIVNLVRKNIHSDEMIQVEI